MAQIKLTITIEASAFSLAHAAIDAMDAKLRQHGGRVVTGKLVLAVDNEGNKHFSRAKGDITWKTPDAPPALTKWVVLYTRIPTNYNPQCKLIVEAQSAADARDLARDHLGDRGKAFSTYDIEDAKPFEPLNVPGRVIGGAS